MLTFGVVVVVAAVSRLLQPTLRGVGGVNTLEEISRVPLSRLDDSVIDGLRLSMAPFTGLVWPPLAGTYLFAISALATGLAWGLALQIRLPSAEGTEPDDARPEHSGSFAVLATLLAWVLPAGLVALTWLSSHSTPVQRRYYIATATLLLVMGTATTANRPLRLLSAGVMTLTIALVVQALLAR